MQRRSRNPIVPDRYFACQVLLFSPHEAHHGTKGGVMSVSHKTPRVVDHFILIYNPEHHRAYPSGYVAEHITVAETLLGRELSPDEDVKHINGNTRDNSPDNLKIVSGSYKVLTLTEYSNAGHKPSKTFVACKYQKPCWTKIRAPIAKKNKIFLPYVCSYQSEGDIYLCSRFWSFHDEDEITVGNEIEGEIKIDSI